jgi:hypothetical protein
MSSCGILRRAALVRTDVSEERCASIIRVARIGELGTMLRITSNLCTLRINTTLLLRNVCSYRRHCVTSQNTEFSISHRHEALKSYTLRLRYRAQAINFLVRFDVSMAVTVKNAVFGDVTPLGSCNNRSFRGTYRLHYQGDKNWPVRDNVSSN